MRCSRLELGPFHVSVGSCRNSFVPCHGTSHQANLKRMAAAAKEAKQRRREEEQEKRSWERQRDKRVAGWQIFMNNVESKKFKTASWAKVGAVGSADRHHTREERTSQDPKVEIDREDVKVRRSATQAGAVGIDQTYKKAWR